MDSKKLFDTISTFDQLEGLSERYKRIYGIEPFNLSFWDPSDNFSKKMLPYIRLCYPQNSINYIFTYQIANLKRKFLIDLGFDPNIKDAIFTPNGTTSIMMVVIGLK
jgi:hypothetical protein